MKNFANVNNKLAFIFNWTISDKKKNTKNTKKSNSFFLYKYISFDDNETYIPEKDYQ